MSFKNFYWAKTAVALPLKTVENIAKEAIKSARNSHGNHVGIQLQVSDYSNRTPVIGHPRDRAPITWQIGARGTNHDRELCYGYDYYNNRIYNKILNCDWFSARLFVT